MAVNEVKLSFSMDTVFFDTLLTELNTVTKLVKIYNPHNLSVKIDEIKLIQPNLSSYVVNIDGVSGSEFTNVILSAKDSLWVFVKMVLNSTNQNNPFIVQGALRFTLGSNIQELPLLAWGRNARFFRNLPGENYSLLTEEDSVWNADLPYVIVGDLHVPSTINLRMEAGVEVYFYNNSALTFLEGCSFKAQGTKDLPIVFTSTRQDFGFKNTPGQWRGLLFKPGCTNVYLNHVKLTNAQTAIRTFSRSYTQLWDFEIHNIQIYNCLQYGISAFNSTIQLNNGVINNCLNHAIHHTGGGKLSVIHSSVSAFKNGNGTGLALNLNNKGLNFMQELVEEDWDSVEIFNSILYGPSNEEIQLNNLDTSKLTIQNSLLKTRLHLTDYQFRIHLSSVNESPLFINSTLNNLQLLSNSPATHLAHPSYLQINPSILNQDILGASRNDLPSPSSGAYQFLD